LPTDTVPYPEGINIYPWITQEPIPSLHRDPENGNKNTFKINPSATDDI